MSPKLKPPTDVEILQYIAGRLCCDHEDILDEFKKLMEEDNAYRSRIDKLERRLLKHEPTHLSFPTDDEVSKIGLGNWVHWKDGE